LLDDGRAAVAALVLDAIESAPHDRCACAARRARAHLALGDPLAAIDTVNAAGTVETPVSLLVWRARAWLAIGDAPGALRDAAQAVGRSPADPEAVGLYATLLIEHGQAATALAALEAAIRLGAQDSALHVALALALLALDDRAAARDAIVRGLEQHPRNPVLRRLLSRSAPGCAE
jgi:predicted Zn-dependent protease